MTPRRWLSLLLIAVTLMVSLPSPAHARSLDFDGSNGTISFKQFGSLSGATRLTWTAWINIDNVAVRTYFMQDFASTAFNIGIDSTVGNAGLRFDTHSNGGLLSIAATPPVGVWTHVAVRFDGTAAGGARARFYLDGLLQTITAENTGVNMGTVADTTIFQLGATITSTFNGRMYNVKIFLDALTEEQIQAEMQCYRPQATSLFFWAPLDGGDKVIADLAFGRLNSDITSGISVSESTPPLDYCGAGG